MQSSQEALTDSDWQYIKEIVDNGRKRKTDLRMVVDAILLLTRTGRAVKSYFFVYLPQKKYDSRRGLFRHSRY